MLALECVTTEWNDRKKCLLFVHQLFVVVLMHIKYVGNVTPLLCALKSEIETFYFVISGSIS